MMESHPVKPAKIGTGIDDVDAMLAKHIASAAAPSTPLPACVYPHFPPAGELPLGAFFDVHGKPLVEIYNGGDIVNLFGHFHNGNPWNAFVMGMPGSGPQRYFRSKKLGVKTAIARAVKTMEGNAGEKERMAYCPYPCNPTNESPFAVFDFDAHSIDQQRALYMATLALNQAYSRGERLLILEDSGRGYHVWILSITARPCEEWIRELTEIAAAVPVQICPGLCEIFPAPKRSESGSFGSAIRAPGTLNPTTGKPSRILYESVGELIQKLKVNPPLVTPPSFPKKDKCFSSVPITNNKEKETVNRSFNENKFEETKFDDEYLLNWAKRFPIERENGRNQTLKNMVESMFPQLGRATGRRIAEMQFRLKSVTTAATVDDHLKDYDDMWNSMEKTWLSQLSLVESQALSKLTNHNDRDAFRIFRGFSRWAVDKGEDEFPIVQSSIAKRLGLTRPGAGKLVRRFIDAGLLKRTAEYVPCVSAARYSWLLPSTLPAPATDEANRAVDSSAFRPARPKTPDELEEEKTTRKMATRFASQIISLLAVYGPLTAMELGAKIDKWESAATARERALVHLERRLVIDLTSNGKYQCGPTLDHFSMFRAMRMLLTVAMKPIADTHRTLSNLTRHFPFSTDQVLEARDRLIDCGLLIKNQNGQLEWGNDLVYPGFHLLTV